MVLDHEAVPGFMGAMAMAYRLKDPSIVSELHAGDRISATISVRQNTDGEFSVPDFGLVNQSGRTIHLRQYRGKLLLATFIYTRCTLADFCPRMSRNFAAVDQQLAATPAAYAATHLLSISFDPDYDTPEVLRRYGGSYTGRFADETFAHWDFAAPPSAELPAITQFFGIGITPGTAGSLNHSLSTVLIGKDGRVVAWYPTNDWQPADLVREVKAKLATG